jgi:hypothetical protein
METQHVELASRVEASIRDSLDTKAWERYQATEQAEHASMLAFFRQYSIVHQGSPEQEELLMKGLERRLDLLEVAMRPKERLEIVAVLLPPDTPPRPEAIRVRVALPTHAPATTPIQTPGG